jgi:hypothetical protein
MLKLPEGNIAMLLMFDLTSWHERMPGDLSRPGRPENFHNAKLRSQAQFFFSKPLRMADEYCSFTVYWG